MKKLAVIVLTTLFASTPALADDDHPVVEYREKVMDALGAHLKASSFIMKGQVDRKEDLVVHAEAIRAAARLVPHIFPPESAPDKMKSDSKPEVWTDWDGFLKASKALEDASAKLLEAAKSGDMNAYKAQFGAVGKSCGDCHKAYRVDD